MTNAAKRLTDDQVRLVEQYPHHNNSDRILRELAADLLEARETIATYKAMVSRFRAGQYTTGEARLWFPQEDPVTGAERALLEALND